MSQNSLVASDLKSDDHLSGYSRHFEKNNSARYKRWFYLINVKLRVAHFKVFVVKINKFG